MHVLKDTDFIKFKSRQESQFIASLSDYSESIKHRMQHGSISTGDKLPWSKTHENFRMRGGEVSIWAGINGHGKSLMLSHVTASLMRDRRILLASLEMPIEATAERMFRQIAGNSDVEPSFVDRILKWTDQRFWIYDQLDTIPPDRVLGMIEYAFDDLNIDHVIVDSLMKCGIHQDDYNKQGEFVDALCWMAKRHKKHIHLVHHMRKGENEYKAPNKFDLKGSGIIADMVDNIIIVHRNLLKESDPEKYESMPDATADVAKQRHGEWIGRINLWFHKPSMQYLPSATSGREWFDLS